MKKFSKKIGALISGLLPILSVTSNSKAMKEGEGYFAPLFYNRDNCPTGHIDRAPDDVVKQMISDAWNLTPEKHKEALESYNATFGMHPYPIHVTGLKALNKISNNRGKIATTVTAPPTLFLAYKYGAFNKIGNIVKDCISGNKTQFEDYENQYTYSEKESDNSDASTRRFNRL